jgi:transcription initiation factor TFIIB
MASRNIYEQTFDEDVQEDEQQGCPECDGRVTTNAHETVCEDCGLILADEQIDHGPEWREFDEDETTQRRTGAPNTVARHDRGIGSEIGRKQDSQGRTLSGKKRRHLGRLRREHTRAKIGSKADRNLLSGMVEIRRMTAALDFTESLRDQACQLFRTAQNEDVLRGRSIESIASGCLYAACRLNEYPRTFEEIATVSKLDEGKVRMGYKVLNRELELPVPPAGAEQYLPQIASETGVSNETERRARTLLEDALGDTVARGCNPAGVAAGALYVAGQETGELLTQAETADAADVSNVTVRERYREIRAASA